MQCKENVVDENRRRETETVHSASVSRCVSKALSSLWVSTQQGQTVIPCGYYYYITVTSDQYIS